MKKIYREPGVVEKDEFLSIIASGSIEEKCVSIVDAVHSISDYRWLVEQYTQLIQDPDLELKGVTVTCIGHLARLHENSDRNELLQLLEPLLNDLQIKGRVEDAIDDINQYLN